ncbi:glycosyl hydrolase family 28-related protein [Pseudopedobacter beijingensis]|uniref:Glycosyl hydrolase family 28-related protein n=1 Tax=Pseudopedobacter beijingensis TaxID=1207056 RepID=A0ABW4ICQ6_9SPHI
MCKCLSLLLLITIFFIKSFGQNVFVNGFTETINPAVNIIGISSTTIKVSNAETFSYSVDTKDGEGKISTIPTIKAFLSQVKGRGLFVYRNGKKQETLSIVEDGDVLQFPNGKKLLIKLEKGALNGILSIVNPQISQSEKQEIVLNFKAGQRSPNASFELVIPKGIQVKAENIYVNIIGRGEVLLANLDKQSIGRVGTNYSYSKVGTSKIEKQTDGSQLIKLNALDLRPDNGIDVQLKLKDVVAARAGNYIFKSRYFVTEPEKLSSSGNGSETATIQVVNRVADFRKVISSAPFSQQSGKSLDFDWTSSQKGLRVYQSSDNGKNWIVSKTATGNAKTRVIDLIEGRQYQFQLLNAAKKPVSKIISHFVGKQDVKTFGVKGDGIADDTDKINEAIAKISNHGGGILLFDKGTFLVRTVHLKSNVWLYVAKEATIKAIKGADAPELTWFSDRKYRSGLSPTDRGPYENPENWLTKQDVGHTYFKNAMFSAEREDNIKIIGNGRITGDGNLVTSDKVMNNEPNNRADKMFALKLCTNIEIGGIERKEDLWYDEGKDQPYYIKANGAKDFDVENMLDIDRGGHFVLLATGTDHIFVHNTYFGKYNTSNVRDIYDFMACNDVTATNIYCKVSSDDIVKPGSDCSLGFTRPAKKFRVRNIIGDTNCNLFQIGSETADDIMDACVDNIFVLGANKAGFSISTNDGAHIKDIHLNCGHTGTLHSRSQMRRTTTPFFISISNRARILGANVSRHKFDENGVKHDELLVNNVGIGKVENIILNGVDITEVYGGSSFGNATVRWKAYDGKQRKATAIVAGYALPDNSTVEGGLGFKLPNGEHTGYIQNISFNDVHILYKGGNLASDKERVPQELGVGQYNVSNLGVQPSYGLWARHAKNVEIKNSSFNFETNDNRYVFYFDDVKGAKITDVEMMKGKDSKELIGKKDADNISVKNAVYYSERWKGTPYKLDKDGRPQSEVNER